MSAGQSSLEQMLGVYKWVVDDVVKNCREDFLNEGVDVQVLEDLKQLWENKLVISGALNRPKKANLDPPPPKVKQQRQQQQQHTSSASPPQPLPPPPSVPLAVPSSITSVIQQAPPKTQNTVTATVETRPSTAPSSLPPPPLIDTTQLSLLQPQLHQVAARTQNVPGSVAASTSVATPSASSVYSLAGAMAAGVQPIMVSNPAAAGLLLQQHRGLGMTYMMPYLPIVQQQAALAALAQQQRLQQQQQNNPNDNTGGNDLEQSDGPPPAIASSPFPLPPTIERIQSACEGPCKMKEQHAIWRRRRQGRIGCQLQSCAGLVGHASESIVQLDGPMGGSSSEESDEGSDDSDEDEEQQDADEASEDEDPLNSADDADSDEDDQALETDNTIVCQFEKVYRVRTKWKFALKDGIMNLKGYDYIFTKTTGEADW